MSGTMSASIKEEFTVSAVETSIQSFRASDYSESVIEQNIRIDDDELRKEEVMDFDH